MKPAAPTARRGGVRGLALMGVLACAPAIAQPVGQAGTTVVWSAPAAAELQAGGRTVTFRHGRDHAGGRPAVAIRIWRTGSCLWHSPGP